jgi:cytochrome c oxidase subunit II
MHYIAEILRILLFLPPQASDVASQIDWLHFSVILVSLLGAGAIALVALVFCWRYRQPAQRKAGEARPRAPTPTLVAELIVVGGLFTLFVVWWGVGFWQFVKIAQPPANTYDIYVSGKQWMWKFAYPNGSHSVDTLYVPANQPVRLILTSRDVIHSFFVPDFRVKNDAVPGRYTTLWFTARAPGTHRIFCAEYCGTWHSRMQGQVIALSASDFQHWLREGEHEPSYTLDPDAPQVSAGESSLLQRGQQVAAAYGCLRCHSVDGSPHIGPTWAGLYDAKVPLEDGQSVVADVAYLTESMMDPRAKVHRGFQTVMPSYIGYLKPAEVAAVVTYIKALRYAPSVAALAPVREPARGIYQPPDTGATRRPPPAGEIGPAPGQAKRVTEVPELELNQGGLLQSAPNPVPSAPREQLQELMLRQREDNTNERQP